MTTYAPSSIESGKLPTILSLRPKPTERVLVVGQTGSGKTVLMENLLKSREYVVVHDAKHAQAIGKWRGYRVITRARDLAKLVPDRDKRIIYRPSENEVQDLEVQNAFFRWIFHRRNTTVYVDETFMLQVNNVWPRYHFLCVTQGRDRRVEVWSGMQRPTLVPLVTLTEAEHVFMFRLQYDEDRMRMEGVTGLNADELSPRSLPKHVFWYVQTGEEPIGPLKLDLEGG